MRREQTIPDAPTEAERDHLENLARTPDDLRRTDRQACGAMLTAALLLLGLVLLVVRLTLR
jgi:hypothetical protein